VIAVRWTRPFWPLDDRVVIPGVATPGSAFAATELAAVALRNAWLGTLGLGTNVSLDAYGVADPAYGEGEADIDREWREFAALCARVGRRLHDEGVIVAVFGRPIPVRVTDIEGIDSNDGLTLAANPPGVADEYAAWCVRELGAGIEQALTLGWTHEQVRRWIAERCRDHAMLHQELRKLDDPASRCISREVGMWDRARWEGIERPAPWDAAAWVDVARGPRHGSTE
jgi:hypothetical protein